MFFFIVHFISLSTGRLQHKCNTGEEFQVSHYLQSYNYSHDEETFSKITNLRLLMLKCNSIPQITCQQEIFIEKGNKQEMK